MGKKGGWFSALKKALSPDSKEKKDQRSRRSKKGWFGTHSHTDQVPQNEEITLALAAPPLPLPVSAGDLKPNSAENEQSKHAYSVALATAVAAEAAVAAAQAAAEVVRLTTISRFSGKSREELAAIKIQTAFRGYMARRALRALRGLVRLRNLIQGQSVKRQATTTLQCMQTLARLQSQIRARRIRMSEENRALQRQLELQNVKELDKLKVGDEWDDSTQSREQIEKRLLNRQKAAMRRERALAYAFSHQQALKSPKSSNPTFMDPNNPSWGWSWLERWMAARPWETGSTSDYNDGASVKSTTTRAMSFREITRSYSEKPSPTAQKMRGPQISSHSPSTPLTTKAPKMRPCSPKGSNRGGGDDDSRSAFSMRSEQAYFRGDSIGGSSVRDDESLASSPPVPSYMASTKSAKARSRLPSPLGLERYGSAPEKGSVSAGPTPRKRLSFQGSPAGARRHSGPPKIGMGSREDIHGGTYYLGEFY